MLVALKLHRADEVPGGDHRSVILRPATRDDLPTLRALIEASMRGLSDGFYTTAQVESGLRHVYGPDTQLIEFVCIDKSAQHYVGADGVAATPKK